jgi:hypothetical protein
MHQAWFGVKGDPSETHLVSALRTIAALLDKAQGKGILERKEQGTTMSPGKNH